MEPTFPFETMLFFGFVSTMLLAGVFLRAKVRLFQNYLIPSCLLGGGLGLVLTYTATKTGLIHVDLSALETFAYHFFNISFISVGLTPGDRNQTEGQKKEGVAKGAWWMALIEGVTFPLQAVIGGLIVIALGFFGMELFPTFGFFVPLGFTEGPGQALSVGKAWVESGFAHAPTIGLTFAVIGFGFAFLVGVPLVNWGIRKGYSAHGPKEIPQDFLIGIRPKDSEKESAGEMTLHSGNIDTLAYHTALVGLVYVVSYGLVFLLSKVLGGVLHEDAAAITWGFFFFWGMLVALLIRWVMGKIGVAHLIDPGIQRRITGWSVDFMVVCTVAAIQVAVVWQYIIPISLIGITAGVTTLLTILYLGRRLGSYNLERIAAIYGTCTGTVSSGLLLLRIVDPEFKTPVAMEVGIMNVFVVPIIFSCMVLVNAPLWWGWSVGLTILVYAAIMTVCLIVIRVMKYWGEPKF
jgi:ESS family glutamate:Na+ symporter